MIDVHLSSTAIAAGETLSGTLTWNAPNAKVPKKATISIGWVTEGRGTRDRRTVQEVALDPNQLASSQGVPIPFSLQIPPEGPITYNGSLIRIIWEMKVLIDLPGLFARDDKQSWQVEVLPRQPQ